MTPIIASSTLLISIYLPYPKWSRHSAGCLYFRSLATSRLVVVITRYTTLREELINLYKIYINATNSPSYWHASSRRSQENRVSWKFSAWKSRVCCKPHRLIRISEKRRLLDTHVHDKKASLDAISITLPLIHC